MARKQERAGNSSREGLTNAWCCREQKKTSWHFAQRFVVRVEQTAHSCAVREGMVDGERERDESSELEECALRPLRRPALLRFNSLPSSYTF